ncbi:hypothetical protein [Lacrimispora sp. 38-1]|uniref:prenylated flavin chaperone LpdD n=1 Tax=Lacrimispora sp. 38-1 TaxID=3125778 RepID=UPI003CF4E498
MISKTWGSGKYAVNLSVHVTKGNGLAVFISGGEKPHLGGVALASPGVPLDGQQLSSCDLWTLTVPGHKDAQLAQRIAKKLCIAAGEPVSVSLGVHVEHATAEEIKLLCENVEAAADLFLKEYLEND